MFILLRRKWKKGFDNRSSAAQLLFTIITTQMKKMILFASISLLVFLLFVRPRLIESWNVALSVSTSVSRAIAGEIFTNPPTVRVTDRTGVFKPDFQGKVHIKLSNPNKATARLWRKNGPELGAGTALQEHLSIDGVYSAPIVHGEATFLSLYVNQAAENYRFRFLLTDNNGTSVASTYSEPFSVDVGEPYQIGVVLSPSTVLGSIPFQSMVAVQDKGFNTVRSVHVGTVSSSFV